MRINLCYIFLLILLVCTENLSAQTNKDNVVISKLNTIVRKNIEGTIIDQTDANNPVIMATVRLLNPEDSSMVSGTITDNSGKFLFKNIPQSVYILSVSYIGYNTFYKDILFDNFLSDKVDVGQLKMEESSIMLATVTVTADVAEVVVKEDTLEYNPAAFKMQENAVVEDLLKRLPGIEVDMDGKVTSAGKTVKRVFVDGEEFFGTDPKMATKNLTLDIIDKVQVVEKKSDLAILTGVDDGETETIINLTVKKGKKQGWMGNISGGAGSLIDTKVNKDARYATNTMVNRFMGKDQLSFVANANNINEQGFTDGGNTVKSGVRSGGGNGITSSNTFGINTVNHINNKLKLGGNFRYGYDDTYVNRTSFRQNLLIDSVSYRESESRDQNYSNNFSFDGRLDYKLDSLTNITFSPTFSYNLSDTKDFSRQATLAGDADSTRVNESTSQTNMHTSGLKVGAQLNISRKFSKEGRRLSLSARFNLDQSAGEGTNISESRFFFQPAKDKKLNQEPNTDYSRNSYSMRLSYAEPVGNNNFLNFYYNIQFNKTLNIKETYDYNVADDTYSILNPDYSKSLDNNFITQTFSLAFNSVRPKYTYNLGLNVMPSSTQSRSFIKNGMSNGNDSTLNRIDGRNVINYTPQVYFIYRFDSQANVRFDYRGNTRQPSVNQLDPTPNNMNPLNIRTGNPDLLPAFSNDISLRFNKYNRMAQQSLTASINQTFTLNEIINFTAYESETGIQHTRPINENGSWNLSGDMMFNTPVRILKGLQFNTNTRIGYVNQIGYTTVQKQSEKNVSRTLNFREALGVSYSKDWFYGQIRGVFRTSNTENSLEGKENQRNTTFSLIYNTQCYLPSGWVVASDINYQGNRGLASGYNKDEVIWNAEISKSILKNKNGTLRFRITDILQQKLNISRSVTGNYIEDSEYNALTSYFLVSFSCKFNTMGNSKKKKQKHIENFENNAPAF